MPAIDVSRAPAFGSLKVLTGKPTGGVGRVSAPAVPDWDGPRCLTHTSRSCSSDFAVFSRQTACHWFDLQGEAEKAGRHIVPQLTSCQPASRHEPGLLCVQVPVPATAGADGSPSSEVHSVSTVDTFAAVGSAEVAHGLVEALAGAVPFVPVTAQAPHQPAVLQVGALRLAAASAA